MASIMDTAPPLHQRLIPQGTDAAVRSRLALVLGQPERCDLNLITIIYKGGRTKSLSFLNLRYLFFGDLRTRAPFFVDRLLTRFWSTKSGSANSVLGVLSVFLDLLTSIWSTPLSLLTRDLPAASSALAYLSSFSMSYIMFSLGSYLPDL